MSNTSSIQHEFIAIDEGLGTLLHVDERDPSRDWSVPIGHPQARDMQLIGGNRILIGHHHGFSEFDIATGTVVAEFNGLEGVTAARRQPDGSTWIVGLDLAGARGVGLLELGADRRIQRQVGYAGDYVRLMRQTEGGTMLLMCDTCIREADANGNYLRQLPVAGFAHTWKALRLRDGRTFASAGYGAFMVELAPDGSEIRRFGTKGEVGEAVSPYFYAMFQLLAGGSIVVANWQGHGEGHGASGVQLLEFGPRGDIIWSWSDAGRISSLQGVLVLDGLDVSRLHDERGGVMEPYPA